MADQDQFDREPDAGARHSSDQWSEQESHESGTQESSNLAGAGISQTLQTVHGNQLVAQAISSLGGGLFTLSLIHI